jgi:Ca2+-transporting ATPase
VPGNLIDLEAGDNVPADCRVVWATANFATSEASLTGESNPVIKTASPLEERDVPLADRANMVYMGTSVVAGKARAVVVETAMETELGQIAGMIQGIERVYTPLQRRLEQFGKSIVYIAFVQVALVFLLGILRKGALLDMFLTAVSLAVAAIPEGLPAVVTIALALGVQKMVKRHALIRKLPSVEALGSATVICSDKTGTLTKNEMTVQAVFAAPRLFRVSGIGYEPAGDILLDKKPVAPADQPDLKRTLECGVLCNGSQLVQENGNWRIAGDPTEGALLTAAAKAGIHKAGLEKEYLFVEEIPFDAERKKMSIVRKKDGAYFAFVKGAPDVLLCNCTRIGENGTARPISESDRMNILKANDSLANEAMRVLAFAVRPFDHEPQDYDAKNIEQDLTFLGLMAMIDPPREEAREAIKKCISAGIRTVMITGDHKNTAAAIGRELGLFRQGTSAMTGEELDDITDDELQRKVGAVSVFARVSPEHKLRIVRAFRHCGEITAMTGDGVNDAPAVKEADIGIAMGITGTDVTKEVSDMVVTDDNFASIVAAVEEGRGIYDNIRKFIHYLLSCNTGEILVMFAASLAGWPAPLLPIHILWVNLITDGLPALALGVDPTSSDVMNRPPRPPGEPIITKERGSLMLVQGAFIALCSLAAFIFVLNHVGQGLERARTAAFIVLAVSQLFHSFNTRSMTRSLFSIGVFSNMKLVYAAGVSFLLLMVVVYVPFFQAVFKTQPLCTVDWTLVLAVSSFPLWAMELLKLINKKTKMFGE